MNTIIKKYLMDTGLSVAQLSRVTGLPYVTVSQHVKGLRSISPKIAKIYKQALGIPLYVLRPDIWEKPDESMPSSEKCHTVA